MGNFNNKRKTPACIFAFFKMPLLFSSSSYRCIRFQEPVATLISTGATFVLAAITLTKPEKSGAFDKGAVYDCSN
jgi:hypothetical protein